MTHKRNWMKMGEALRCNAKTRSGLFCKSPAVKGKLKCRMHGGALRSGAPLNNSNALKHGLYTHTMREHRRRVNAFLREGYEIIADLSR